uniref:Uncharacterized protein n=1 Tax=Chrysotila carterae TaxID=13221 RepID=A0A7S4EUF5_CHRCT|mmetsp:Transcript_12961/g.27596  ORF Transcript_12961/g.27596 Transcript_12961/m.27596 type:complete len:204 (+) Transcript_12961:55-666(+)
MAVAATQKPRRRSVSLLQDRMQGEELHMTAKIEQFRASVLFAAEKAGVVNERNRRMQRLKFISFDSWKEMPDVVFDHTLGGRDAAKAIRKRIVAARKQQKAREAAEASLEAELTGDNGVREDSAQIGGHLAEKGAQSQESKLGTGESQNGKVQGDDAGEGHEHEERVQDSAVPLKRRADDDLVQPDAKAIKSEATEASAPSEQ